MRSLDDIKKFRFSNGEWLDENGNILNVLWSTKLDPHTTIEHHISEKIEDTEIDGVTYTTLIYVYGDGLVIADETQRARIRVYDLINNNNTKEEQSNIKNKSLNIKRKKINPQNKGTIKISELTDTDIEVMFGAWALEESKEDLISYLIAKGYNVIE